MSSCSKMSRSSPKRKATKAASSGTSKRVKLESSSEREIVLFLLGKTSAGKSSTGNTILGRKQFEVSDGTQSLTTKVDLRVCWAQPESRYIKVVDGPGLYDSRLSKADAAENMAAEMTRAFVLCPGGFHSLLIVIKYGQHNIVDVMKTVDALKAMFGDNFVRKFCVFVITNGEIFELENPNRTIIDWCMALRGNFQKLLEECDYRVVLFHNLQPEKQESDRQSLIEMVDRLDGDLYTDELFEQAATTREEFIFKNKMPELIEEIQRNLHLVNDSLDKVRDQQWESSDRRQVLDQLSGNAERLLKVIDSQDMQTSQLKFMRIAVEGVMSKVDEAREKKRKKKKDINGGWNGNDPVIMNLVSELQESEQSSSILLDRLVSETAPLLAEAHDSLAAVIKGYYNKQ